MSRLKRVFRFLLKFIVWTGVVLIVLFLFFLWRIQIPLPQVNSNLKPSDLKRVQTGTDSYQIGKNWLRKNKEGIWVMYIEGNDYERGVVYAYQRTLRELFAIRLKAHSR